MAKRFDFRLEHVLRFRQREEEAREREFAMQRAQLLSIDGDIQQNRDTLHSFIHENSRSEGTFTVLDIVAVDNYITRLEKTIEALEALRARKEEEVQNVLGLLKEAKKARKVIENLKERELERNREELNREENRELDDVSQHIGLNRETLTIEDVPMEDM
jgi:flagellar export protein FliJ